MRLLKITSYWLYLLILILPFYTFRFKVFNLPSTLLEAGFFILFIIWLTSLIVNKRNPTNLFEIRKSKLFYPSLLFLFSGLVAIIVSPSLYRGFGAFRAYILEPMFVFLIIFDLSRSHGKGMLESKLRLFMVLSGVFISLYGLYQYLTGTNQIAPLEALQGRVTSFFNNPNFLALYLAPIILLIMSLILESKVNLHRLGLALILFLNLYAFILTFSQGGWIALGLSTTLIVGAKFYFELAEQKRVFLKKVFFSLLVVSLAVLSIFYYRINDFTPDHKLVWPRPDPQTYVIRLCLWEGTKNLLAHSPILGSGLGGFHLIYPTYQTCDTEHFVYPHNLILNFWTEMGLLGLVSFIWLNINMFKILLRGGVGHHLEIALVGVLSYWLIHGMVDVPYFKNDLSMFFWIVAAMVVLLEQRQWPKEKESLDRP